MESNYTGHLSYSTMPQERNNECESGVSEEGDFTIVLSDVDDNDYDDHDDVFDVSMSFDDCDDMFKMHCKCKGKWPHKVN